MRIFRTKRIAKRKAAFSALLEGAESYDGAAFLFAPKQFWITVLGCGHRWCHNLLLNSDLGAVKPHGNLGLRAA